MTGVAFLDFCAGFFPKVNYQLRDSLLSRFNLPLDRKIKTYSGGMRQQLSLIQALQHEPELLILDEPTSGLDPLARDQFYKIIKELRDGGTTIFFSTHILTEIGRVCDTVCIIKQGRIIEEQRLDILRSKADRYIEITLREEVTKDTFCVPGITEVVRESPVKFTLTVTKQNENEVLSYIKKLPLISFNIKDIGLDQLFLKYFPEHDATKGSEK
jgi:ABC-2 type transport system ATP-binding protein